MKKLSRFTVELDNGTLVQKPSFLFGGDCRICALLNIVCEDLEYPCIKLTRECKADQGCEKCKAHTSCLENKPCCWKCELLFECLELKEWAAEYVEDIYNCTWETYLKAIKTLRGK